MPVPMNGDYYICLVCPLCLTPQWRFCRCVPMTREEILDSLWTFDCPIHGLQAEKPLQASRKGSFRE